MDIKFEMEPESLRITNEGIEIKYKEKAYREIIYCKDCIYYNYPLLLMEMMDVVQDLKLITVLPWR